MISANGTYRFPVLVARSVMAPSKREPATSMSPKLASRDVASACSNGTVPACVQALYNIPLTPAVNKDLQLAVTGFFGNNAHYAWLEVRSDL